MAHPKDYHDYVFKNGKFLGKFDEMYKYSKDIPWYQDKAPFNWHNQIGFMIIRDIVREKGKFEKILEMGCGLGYNIMQFKDYGKKLYGCDISQVAIEKAKILHKGIDFFTTDIKNKMKGKYNLIIVAEVMWYVLDGLENINDS
ncbi:hypothetical protein LCGC14_0435210, partial [marine sediment metagenome]